MPHGDDNPFGEVIFRYTREQAIADGVLIDVTDTAREAGFKLPTAVTANLWAEWIVPEEDDAKARGQSESGRLWDVLSVLRYSIRAQRKDTSLLLFDVLMIKGGRPHTLTVKAHCGPGDEGEPVLTLMLVNED